MWWGIQLCNSKLVFWRDMVLWKLRHIIFFWIYRLPLRRFENWNRPWDSRVTDRIQACIVCYFKLLFSWSRLDLRSVIDGIRTCHCLYDRLFIFLPGLILSIILNSVYPWQMVAKAYLPVHLCKSAQKPREQSQSDWSSGLKRMDQTLLVYLLNITEHKACKGYSTYYAYR